MMAAAMESPMAFPPESPLDLDEQIYPCKGCGEILEEGKAFELAGNRWHIDCFRCSTCNTILDSDANLLLLGDGSLICNNCTYSCSNCGNKIEDLAILTGDQAFCANCFKCRNCKQKIENLRYARTSQGIFCMDCHEALMARRRKKTAKGATSSRTRTSANSGAHVEKSLPALPPPEARKTAYIPDGSPYSESVASPEIPSVSKTMGELNKESGSRPSTSEQNQPRDTLTLPSTTFRNERHSMMVERLEDVSDGGAEEFLIPLAFDPTPSASQSPAISNQASSRTAEEKPKDYFATTRSGSASSQPTPSQLQMSSPHIAYQEKGRQAGKDSVENARNVRPSSGSRSGSANASPFISADRTRQQPQESPNPSQVGRNELLGSEKFKLQDAPKSKRLTSSEQGSHSETSTVREETSAETSQVAPSAKSPYTQGSDYSDRAYGTPRVSYESSPGRNGVAESPRPPQHPVTQSLQSLPKRGDSLEKRAQTIPRKELSSTAAISQALAEGTGNGTPNIKSTATPDLAKVNGGKIISAPIELSDSKSIFDTPNLVQNKTDTDSKTNPESFVAPRAPPAPPVAYVKSRNESISTMQSDFHRGMDHQKSPSLPRYSAGGDFSMDEDMARILGGDEQANHESFLRRVSNSVRHGRSFSDRGGGRLSRDKWPRSPINATASIGQEISSPSTASPEHRDELAWFKNELQRERQKTIEREKRIAELEAALDSTDTIKQVNSELREKRSTMVVLDTQKEIVVRELEVLTEHIASAKASSEPFDIGKMSSSVLRDFATALERLKNSFAPLIEDSIQKRNDLMDEISNLTQMKDKSFMEFEQLSSKNAQLAELNNQLVHQIQGLYKANSGSEQSSTKPQVNGLGIYSHHKDKSQMSIDSKELRNLASDVSIADTGMTLIGSEAEPVTVLQGPHVVNIRKAQPKKFDWRRGQKVAKGVTKGLKGAFSSAQQGYSREMQFAETGAYGSTPAGSEYSNMPKSNQEPIKQGSGFGFFSNQRSASKANGLHAPPNNSSTPSLLLDASSHLFGSDLEQRAEYEKSTVPYIVKRCVEEVEDRGMDVEGIYRKSGGNSQVQQVRDTFERSLSDCDISDPDLDIHAVTSGLKQYFRRLPIPLITYDVYDLLLDTTSIADKDLRIDAMQKGVESLPRVHYETLEFLIKHLARVVENEKENLMTSMNIAVVFAPTIMRPESLGRELSDTKMKNEVIMWMVEEAETLFKS